MSIDEYTIFEITGRIFWISIDVSLSLFVLLVAVYVPLRVANWWKNTLWDWIWAAKIADTGYTEDDLIHAYQLHGSPLKGKIELDELIRWLAHVKERAADIKSQSAGKE